MQPERRKDRPAIPDDWKRYFNSEQFMAMNRYSSFGWTIKFIRRPLFQDAVIVMVHADTNEVGVLNENGEIDRADDIVIRD